MQEDYIKKNSEQDDSINIREEIEKYLLQWRWFLVSVLVFLAIAFFYLRYSTPIYKSTTKILVKDDRKGGIANELSAFSELGILSGTKSNVDNEIEIIKSRTLIEKTIKDLSLNVKYYNKGRIKDGELYGDLPFKVFFSNYENDFYNLNKSYSITKINNQKFTLFDAYDKKLGDYDFGQKIKLKFSDLLVINQNQDTKKDKEVSVSIQIVPLKNLTEAISTKLLVSALSKNTSVIELSITDATKQKAEDFLNTLVKNYNEDAIADKNFVSESTSDFINQRLVLITKELEDVESDEQSFKTKNKLTDIQSEAGLFLENASEYEKKVVENEMELKVVSIISNAVVNNNKELIPASMINSESGANEQINQYNQLILKRKNLLETGAGLNNPNVLAIDGQISDLKTTVNSSLKSLKQSLEIKKRDLNRQGAILDGRISQIPGQEKEFRGLKRQQNIKEALYLYLLQKREEAAISLAITSANAKVIDSALSSVNPVSPNRKIIYLGSFLVGLLLPFSVIYLKNLLDTKIKSRVDIEKNTSIPFLGDVPKSTTFNQIIDVNSRSSTAEALRIIRTNLEFLFNNKTDKSTAKTIFVTSTFPKEGKTFLSINIAATIALSGKKVLLIGMDVRNPKLNEYLNVPVAGLTNFLTSSSNDVSKYIIKQEGFEQFFILPSGVIPPNPAELLMNEKVDNLFENLKQEYDYIVVDTAPVGLVTDTFVIAKQADCFLYVVRANMLDKRMLRIPEELYTENKLPNMAVILNDTDTNKGYGYGYGYVYGYGAEIEENKSWFKKKWNKFNS